MGIQREVETTFDWFKSYKDVAHLVRAALPDEAARILMLGCGNSTLSEDVSSQLLYNRAVTQTYAPFPGPIGQMYDDGYKNIVNIDVRSVPSPRPPNLTVRVS
jgi:hypothetical protein